jgi:tetratricopeptide (TPR) repeat protein
VAAQHIGSVHYHLPQRQVVWPLRVGAVPLLASAFRDRAGIRERIRRSAPTLVLVGGGGVGKSQLAAYYAHDAAGTGTDLVVWVDAGRPETVVATYAQAAARVGAPGVTGLPDGADADARAFLDWLAVTDRSWLVVLDDIAEPEHVAPWWPAGHPGTGWVLATSRRRDAALSGGGRAVIDVDVYTPGEAVAYLTDRLGTAGGAHLLDGGAAALVEALGFLPLALSHAAAYMVNQDVPCANYLRLYTNRRTRLEEALPRTADTEGYGRSVAVTLLLAVDAAQAADPPGLALPALRLAAVLDPAGHPETVWATAAVTGLLTTLRTATAGTTAATGAASDTTAVTAGTATTAADTGTTAAAAGTGSAAVTAAQARAAMRLLHRYSLLTHHATAGPRAVRIHALTARAAQESTPGPELAAVARAAADALLDVWPSPEPAADELSAALRANTDTLIASTGDLLWRPDGHQLLHHAGNSLLGAGLFTANVAYWQRLAGDALRYLGPAHADTLAAQGNWGVALQRVGRTAEAVPILETVAADAMALFGRGSAHTLNARAKLGITYEEAGRLDDALRIATQVAAARMDVNGPDHRDTLGAWVNLAATHRRAGHLDEAVRHGERAVADTVRVFGTDDAFTLHARLDLAIAYRLIGRVDEAVGLTETIAADYERVLGAEHPDTLVARAQLGNAYQDAGRAEAAMAVHAEVATGTEALLGPLHPDTLAAKANLAAAHLDAGRPDEAAGILAAVIEASTQVRGPHHPDTLLFQSNLAHVFQEAERADDAIRLGEQVTADLARVLGPDHPETWTALGNLAVAYSDAGRVDDAIPIEEAVAAGSTRVLGPEHPDTLTSRANLAVSYWEAGRDGEALTVAAEVVAGMHRVQHPDAAAFTELLTDWLRA